LSATDAGGDWLSTSATKTREFPYIDIAAGNGNKSADQTVNAAAQIR